MVHTGVSPGKVIFERQGNDGNGGSVVPKAGQAEHPDRNLMPPNCNVGGSSWCGGKCILYLPVPESAGGRHCG